MLYKDEIS